LFIFVCPKTNQKGQPITWSRAAGLPRAARKKKTGDIEKSLHSAESLIRFLLRCLAVWNGKNKKNLYWNSFESFRF